MPTYSRRNFLKVSVGSALALAFRPELALADSFNTLGRVATPYLRVYSRPSTDAKQIDWLGFDEVVRISDSALDKNGQLWYETNGGYIQTTEVQPVANRLNPVLSTFPNSGSIAEVTVPFTDARRQPQPKSGIIFRLYYGSTYWIKAKVQGTDGQAWYKLYDERLGVYYYAPAQHLRIVKSEETSPLSPTVSSKQIIVNLKQQRLRAFEGKTEVFSTLISAGRLYLASDGTYQSWTPSGQFQVERKKPSRHMGSGEAAGSDYELPGVPWVSYFHWKGFSFHGTWWHNDYGHPRSAGCINMKPAEALWIFRWSQPTALPDQELTTGQGTSVEIVED